MDKQSLHGKQITWAKSEKRDPSCKEIAQKPAELATPQEALYLISMQKVRTMEKMEPIEIQNVESSFLLFA